MQILDHTFVIIIYNIISWKILQSYICNSYRDVIDIAIFIKFVEYIWTRYGQNVETS